MLGVYVPASTANPTGRRPWNSRLSFYTPNTFAVPTTGRGRFLLQPDVNGCPQVNGGLGCDGCAGCGPKLSGLAGTSFPNYATFERPRQSRRRFASNAPRPVYGPADAVTSQLSGLGLVPSFQWPSSVAPIIVGRSRTWWAQPAPPAGSTPTPMPAPDSPAPSSGFTPVGTAPSGAMLYTSAPGLAPQAAGQGFYQVGVDPNGYPIYSNVPPVGGSALPTSATVTPAPAAVAPASSASAWLSQDALGFGLSNGWYLGIGGAALLLFMRGRR